MSITSILSDYNFFSGFALAWGIFEWYSYKPKLRIDIKTDMVKDKSGKILVIDHKNEHDHDKKGISIQVVNVGKVPTTIRYITIQQYKRGIFRKERQPIEYLLNKFTSESSSMPTVLKPGEIWLGLYNDQAYFFKLSKEFTLETQVHHSFSKKPKTAKLKFLEHQTKKKLGTP